MQTTSFPLGARVRHSRAFIEAFLEPAPTGWLPDAEDRAFIEIASGIVCGQDPSGAYRVAWDYFSPDAEADWTLTEAEDIELI